MQAGQLGVGPAAGANSMVARSLFCPVCGKESNRAGSPFASEWAVATHVAGCIYVGDKLHRSWAIQHAPGVGLSQTVPSLAEAMLWVIHQAIEASRPKTSNEGQTPVTVLHSFERKLHRYVRQRLEQHFGVEREAWWVQGVPVQIRQDCAQRRETDPERAELYQHTFLIDLKAIMEKNWAVFEEDHARLRSAVPELQKKQFLDLLTRVNEVRNRHSHPVRAPDSDSEQYATDLLLARTLERMVDVLLAFRGEIEEHVQTNL